MTTIEKVAYFERTCFIFWFYSSTVAFGYQRNVTVYRTFFLTNTSLKSPVLALPKLSTIEDQNKK